MFRQGELREEVSRSAPDPSRIAGTHHERSFGVVHKVRVGLLSLLVGERRKLLCVGGERLEEVGDDVARLGDYLAVVFDDRRLPKAKERDMSDSTQFSLKERLKVIVPCPRGGHFWGSSEGREISCSLRTIS